MELSSLELKFLLRLLEYSPDYRTRISQIKPNDKTRASERDKICLSLCSRGLVGYTEEIQQYQIESDGKTFLKADHTNLPVPMPSDELALLKAASTKAATPGQTKKVPASERQRLLHKLKERKFINITKSRIGDVWLTPQGVQYLLSDCIPNGTGTLTFSMLGTYLSFIRQSLGKAGGKVSILQESSEVQPASSTNAATPSPEDVLETSRQLDQQLNTDNFLPIFHLREKLQPPWSRDEVDQLLYELQGRDLIEFSTLQDVSNYSEAEVAAGIPQNIGGALFFISLIE